MLPADCVMVGLGEATVTGVMLGAMACAVLVSVGVALVCCKAPTLVGVAVARWAAIRVACGPGVCVGVLVGAVTPATRVLILVVAVALGAGVSVFAGAVDGVLAGITVLVLFTTGAGV